MVTFIFCGNVQSVSHVGQEVIAPIQTAILSGRRIGENALFLQLIPHLLARGGSEGSRRTAYVAFCAFKNAYDTVDRSFLLQVMERLGVGEGLLRWTRLLFSNTRASALVNGHLSSPITFHAGVRQGCPLAPFLYLFIGQALHCHLLARGFCINYGSQHLLGAWFVLEVLLKTLDEVPRFEEAGGLQICLQPGAELREDGDPAHWS